jgi:hypothetical protein
MKKEEMLMGLAVSVLCMGASSFVVKSQAGNSTPSQQAYLASPDHSSESMIEGLPDGNYRFCSSAAPTDGSESGMCFRFQKTGDRIVGNYQPANSTQASVCIVGRINRNTINGEAIDFSSPTSEPLQLRPELQGGNLVNWNAAGTEHFLKVASGQALDQKKSDRTALVQSRVLPVSPSGSIRFRQASLDLSSFHQYSSGTIEPPTQCGGN